MPIRLAGCHQMINTIKRRCIGNGKLANGVSRHVGNQGRGGRHANLIGNNAQCIPLARQLQHRFHEICAMDAVDPTGPEDQVSSARCCQSLFPGKLCSTIGALRRRRIGFPVKSIPRPREHIIGRVVNDRCAQLDSLLAEYLRRANIDRLRAIRIRLCLVDRRVGGGVDDHIRTNLSDGGPNGICIFQIAGRPVKAEYVAQRREGALKLKANLPAHACQHKTHLVTIPDAGQPGSDMRR